MSNWGSNFNENYNLYQNSFPIHQQNVSNRGSSYETSRNSENNTSSHYSHDTSMMFIANGGGMYNRDVLYGNQEYDHSGVNQPQTSLYNIEISGTAMNRAANSRLTPTAGEFIPRSMRHSYDQGQVTAGPSQENQRYHSQQAYNSGNFTNGEALSRLNAFYAEPLRTTSQDSSSQLHRNYDGTKRQNKKQQQIEQSKAEGRKKLLQEAAGISVAKKITEKASSSKVAPDSTSRRSQNSTDNRPIKVKSNENKVFSRTTKPQNAHHRFPQYSPHRKSSSAATQSNRHKGGDDVASQRDRLTDQLDRGTLECLVCCEHVRQSDHTWSCQNCYHVLHLRCIIKWANTSKAETGWRCPACQNVTLVTPQDYYCFCGKTRSPEWSRTDTAHSCGELCDRPKVLASEHYTCAHRCTLLCHPGPCPPCNALVTRKQEDPRYQRLQESQDPTWTGGMAGLGRLLS